LGRGPNLLPAGIWRPGWSRTQPSTPLITPHPCRRGNAPQRRTPPHLTGIHSGRTHDARTLLPAALRLLEKNATPGAAVVRRGAERNGSKVRFARCVRRRDRSVTRRLVHGRASRRASRKLGRVTGRRKSSIGNVARCVSSSRVVRAASGGGQDLLWVHLRRARRQIISRRRHSSAGGFGSGMRPSRGPRSGGVGQDVTPGDGGDVLLRREPTQYIDDT
jgi:hypothetical protein